MLNVFGIAALGWLVVMSVVTFVVFAWDKFRARSAACGAQRVPEKRLFLLIGLGGAAGAAAAMALLRHKTRKASFAAATIVAFWAWVIVVGWLGTR